MLPRGLDSLPFVRRIWGEFRRRSAEGFAADKRVQKIGQTSLEQRDSPVSSSNHLAAIFKKPTKSNKLANVIRERDELDISISIIEVRPGNEKEKPLFLVHKMTGLDLYFFSLAVHLPAGLPVYGLLAVPLGEEQPRTVETLASRLALEVRKKCFGPYRLAGWAFDGVLAYEVASNLIAQDEEVEFLGLIDSWAPADRAFSEIEYQRTARSALLSLFNRVVPFSQDASREIEEARTFCDLLDIARLRDYLPSFFKNLPTRDIERSCLRLRSYDHAFASYRPEPIGVPVDLFVADRSWLEGDRTYDLRDRYNGWGAYIPPASIRTERIAATHHSIVTTSAVADAFSNALERVGERGSADPPIEYVVEIQSGTKENAPIICVPGAGDNAMAFLDMARAFQDRVPVRAFQARGLIYPDVPHGTVKSAAEAYMSALDAEPSTDAIHLIGHSFGGWVAFEMACTMASRGSRPLSLTIIDAEPPGRHIREYSSDAVFDEWVRTLELVAGRSFDLKPAAMAEKHHLDRIRAVHQKLVELGIMPAASRWDVLRGPLRTFGAALRAGYLPSTSLAFPVNFVFADDPRESAESNLQLQNEYYREWLEWAPLGTRWRGPGNHITILDAPHVNELVSWWQLNQEKGAV